MNGGKGIYLKLSVRRASTSDGVFVTSDDVPGLYLMGKCFVDMKGRLEQAIKKLFLDNERTEVNVIWLSAEEAPGEKLSNVGDHFVQLEIARAA